MTRRIRIPPWERPAPARKPTKLSDAQKSEARERARKAGRRYPNLVDNMTVAAQGKRGAKRKRATAQKTPAKRATRARSGGLTAAGRADFRRKEGAQLKPGVKKAVRDMSPDEMRRKGSWAVRFYGRRRLPPLVDAHGEPTRFALSAHAWGEPVPKTQEAARKIAEKGRRLLARYEREKQA